MTGSPPPITVALVDDYDVVLLGVAHILDKYSDRVVIAEIDTNKPLVDTVDIVLYDSFAQPESDHQEIGDLVQVPQAKRVVVYTWNFHPDLIESAQRQGARGYLSKALPARELVEALEKIHAGTVVVSDPPLRARSTQGLNWPGRGDGLTDRESEILALITQGKNNAEVAALTYLSPNTVKSYIRNVYRKIGVTSRTQAVLWGVANGFTPDHRRIDHWRGGPWIDRTVLRRCVRRAVTRAVSPALCHPRCGRPKVVRTPSENITESGARLVIPGRPVAATRFSSNFTSSARRNGQGPCWLGTYSDRPAQRVCRPNRAVTKCPTGPGSSRGSPGRATMLAEGRCRDSPRREAV